MIYDRKKKKIVQKNVKDVNAKKNLSRKGCNSLLLFCSFFFFFRMIFKEKLFFLLRSNKEKSLFLWKVIIVAAKRKKKKLEVLCHCLFSSILRILLKKKKTIKYSMKMNVVK